MHQVTATRDCEEVRRRQPLRRAPRLRSAVRSRSSDSAASRSISRNSSAGQYLEFGAADVIARTVDVAGTAARLGKGPQPSSGGATASARVRGSALLIAGRRGPTDDGGD